MTGAQYIVESLIRRGVTDAFGIPGGVVLELLYEMDRHKGQLMPHLTYNEQTAGFAACGYAQASRKLGVTYVTRGPGFTNVLTAIADAYYDSLPTLFITAHSAPCPPEGMRCMDDQEMDTCAMVRSITKAALRIDDVKTFAETFERLCSTALEGRQGPVFIDISTRLLAQEVAEDNLCDKALMEVMKGADLRISTDVAQEIYEAIAQAKRPVILAGDGISQSGARDLFRRFAEKSGLPVISSRFAHDIMGSTTQYYGYVGSHGMRCANFILSKTDLILAIGNRLHFPPQSASFGEILQHARIIRVEIDEHEFGRVLPNTTNVHADLKDLLDKLNAIDWNKDRVATWTGVCDTLRETLAQTDLNKATAAIAKVIGQLPENYIVTNDVGNNEFWVSRACVSSQLPNRVYYSKSFGALGCGLGKAIGTYYATKAPVVCFTGDQGLQMNIQELQFIAQHQLPIAVVLLNNHTSGMIKDREAAKYGRFVHTTSESGYATPAFQMLAKGYGLRYSRLDEAEGQHIDSLFQQSELPVLIEIEIDGQIELAPSLPRGRKCQDMLPALDATVYQQLSAL